MKPLWSEDYIVHVDREGDKERASDGYSRYGAYVEAREESFIDHIEGPDQPLEPIAFAAKAWEIASTPVMSPGLVEWRPDIAKISLGYDEDGTRPVVRVELPLRHRELAAKLPATYDDWGVYREWANDLYVYAEHPRCRPGHPAVTVMAGIRHIPQLTLVQPGKPRGRALVDDALRSVDLTATAINAELPEILRNVYGRNL